MRVVHLLQHRAEVEGLAALDRAAFGSTVGDCSVPASICMNLLPTRPSFWIDATESSRSSGCRSSRTRILTRNFAEGEVGTWMSRPHPRPFRRREPCARLQTGDLRELRVDREGVGKQHSPVADQEQADREQQHSSQHERADDAAAVEIHVDRLSGVLRGHERLHQLVVAPFELRRGSAAR